VAIRIGIWLLCALLPSGILSAGGDPLKEAQTAFKAQQYEKALAVIETIKADAPDVRRWKARTLAKLFRGTDALAEYDALTRLSKKDEPALLREVALSYIVPMLKDMRVQMRGAGYTALKEIESEETVPYFEGAFTDESGQVRALAVEGLGQLEAGRRSPRLEAALHDQAAYVRKYALKAYGKTGDRSKAGVVEPFLEDSEPVVRVAAAAALATLNQPTGWERLAASAKSGNPDERSAALLALASLKRTASFPDFEAAAGDKQPSVRAAVMTGLGELGEKKGVPILVKALHDPIPAVRGSAVLSLGKLHATGLTNEITRLLSDKNPGVQADAVAVLMEFGAPYEAVADTVRDVLRNKEPSVRSRIARTLSKGQGASLNRAVEGLQELLQDPLPLPRMSASRVLGHMSLPDGMGMLKEVLHDQDEAVRATAAAALIRVLDGKAGHGEAP